jgi:hypothetical protein
MIKFRSERFRTQRERAAAVAYAYLTADGINSDDVITEALNESTDPQLAADTIEVWGLPTAGATDDHGEPIPADEIYDPADLVRAYAAFRAKHPAAPGGSEDEA